MFKVIITVFLISFHFFCQAQSDSIQARIVLIGDAGELNYGREPVIDAARQLIPFDSKTTVIYLGDNIYNSGLPPDFTPGYQKYKAVLDSQINIANGTKAKVFFIPGNHDWNNEDPNGLEIVNRQQNYISALNNDNIKFVPRDGCPGPEAYEINKDIELIVYDSQWFIRSQSEKPGIESDCESKTPEQFYAELQNLINIFSKKLIILAGHHTLKSYGIHGGYFPLLVNIFPLRDMNPKLWIPLPVLGSIYPIVRGVFGTPEDLHYPAYANMINRIESITKKNQNIIFVAGHEHTLQLIKDSSNYFIVSGAGSKSTRVSKNKHAPFTSSSLGFATLEISNNKNVHVDFYTVNKDSVSHSWSQNLLNFSSLKEEDDSSKIPDAVPIVHFKDSVRIAINASYDTISGIHQIFAGKNYRKEWATPVNLKVFRINKQNGGFKIKSSGGGKQTESLRLVDKNGREWVLRTVDKSPSGSIPEVLKPYVAERIMKDLVTAEHPYGALMVPPLADAANIEHAEPKYFYVPDDPALGFYRKKFANKIVLLEEHDPTENETNTKSTAKVIDKVIGDSKNHVDQEAVLRARLLDMMIGDWDRHFDQWRFGTADTGAGKLYYPIPRDRDQAFFYSNGLFVKGLSLAALPYLQGFRRHYPDIKWFNWEERNFDRFFMNNLDEPTWKRIIKKFQANENDTVINDALKQLPPEIYKIDSAKITAKLRSRRNLIYKNGIRYYNFLSKEVNVVGSNTDEYFKVFNAGDSLEVKVYKRKRNTDSASVMFDRVFSSKSTKFINLYGLNGNDIFEIDSTANSKIKLRIIGGRGKDTFNIRGNVRNTLYDFKNDSNYVEHTHKTKNNISNDANVNQYDIVGYNYNTYRLPLLSVGYNLEDGVNAGLGYSLKTYSFRKDPYSTYQAITSLYNINSGKYQVNYNGEFNQIVGKYDVVGKGSLFNTVLENYFGLGNETKVDKSKGYNFYKVRYNYLSGDLLLRKRFHSLAEINFGPSYYHYWNHYVDNRNKILSQPRFIGLDSANIYSDKTYLGGKVSIIIHNINSDLLPTRGVYWNTELSSLFGMNHDSHQITKITTDMTVYASYRDPTRLVAVLRFGYGHIFSNNYEYFQALSLGENNYLRGFRKDRFAGKSIMYQSTEFRYKLFDSKSYIVPGAVGLLAFNDVGKVWTADVTSHKLHDSFGFGLYYSPYNFGIVSATMAFSNEGSLFNFSLGTKFNITF